MGYEDKVEEILGPLDSQDYKMVAVVEESQLQANSRENWVYIGADPDTPWRAKVGMTSRELGTRASSAQNPEFGLLHAFKVRDGVGEEQVKAIEKQIHNALEAEYHRYPHRESSKKSEWFKIEPFAAIPIVQEMLNNNHGSKMHGYHCPEREIDVIFDWKNQKLENELTGKCTEGVIRAPYRASDNSNPPVSSECATPPGCGQDCDCWG